MRSDAFSSLYSDGVLFLTLLPGDVCSCRFCRDCAGQSDSAASSGEDPVPGLVLREGAQGEPIPVVVSGEGLETETAPVLVPVEAPQSKQEAGTEVVERAALAHGAPFEHTGPGNTSTENGTGSDTDSGDNPGLVSGTPEQAARSGPADTGRDSGTDTVGQARAGARGLQQ